MEGVVVEPIKIAVTDHNAVGPNGDDEFSRPIEEPTVEPEELMIDEPTVEEVKKEAPKPAPIAAKSRLFLFKYVTTLASGLVLLGLVSWAAFALLDYWLGDPAKANIFSEFTYRFQLYLVVSLVLFGGLHVGTHLLTGKVNEADQPPAARVFQSIFLTILAIVVVGNSITLAYIGADVLLGTDNYTMKNLWIVVLGTLKVIVLSVLLWWYFKQTRVKATLWYVVGTASITIAAATLLVMFPVLKQRDAVIDARTSGDLSMIASKVDAYAQKNSKLPANMRDLELDDAVKGRLGAYSYEVSQQQSTSKSETNNSDLLYGSGRSSFSSSTALSYKLCATFKTDTTNDAKGDSITSLFGGSSSWTRHPSGRHCFDQTTYGSNAGGSPELTSPTDEDTITNSLETL